MDYKTGKRKPSEQLDLYAAYVFHYYPEGKKRYLPDSAWNSLSPAEKAATNKAKAAGNAKGKQFVAQPKKIAAKTAKHR